MGAAWIRAGAEEEDYEIIVPSVPPGFSKLTSAQQELADLLQVSEDLLVAAARHSNAAVPSNYDDFAAWVELLPQDRRSDYLVRLARNEPGLSRQLVKELRTLGQSDTSTITSTGERVTYATLLAESKVIEVQREREEYEQEQKRQREAYEREQQARQSRLQYMSEHLDTFWRQAEQAAARGTATGYDEAVNLLVDLREIADQSKETQQFQTRFSTWVQPHMRRPALLKRLYERRFPLPQV